VNVTFGSLFAGIGGLDLGLERAGWQCRWQVEIDPFCQKILSKHWPNIPKFTDVRQIKDDDLEYVDLICGGFPCQPVSVAGKRKGQTDERWLWPEFSKIIRMVRPRFILVENVPGLLSVNRGTAMGEILGDLATGGYDAEWNRVSASSLGAPHLRERIFIVGWNTDAVRCKGIDRQKQAIQKKDTDTERVYQNVADSRGNRLALNRQSRNGSEKHIFRERISSDDGGQFWEVEPDVGRVADGVSARVDRLRCLGNAVVPQVAEWVGKQIIRVMEPE